VTASAVRIKLVGDPPRQAASRLAGSRSEAAETPGGEEE
jgi:hypothetical protein